MRGFFLALAVAALNGMLCLNPEAARAQATDPFIGEIEAFGFNFCPRGWAPLNGQLLSISQNTALFALLGTTYGANGTTNFALPTAKPVFTATEAPFTQCIALFGVFPSRD
jgi:microcystin-dependent protein